MELEICATSLTSVINAAQAGATRVELCSGYAIGGLTPSMGLLTASVALKKIPIHCLIRPREGNFCYSATEITTMREDVIAARKAGAAGVVLGALTPKGELDLPALKILVTAANGMTLGFHRAFDFVKNPTKAISALATLGFQRILSSGGALTALEGLVQLKAWDAKTPEGIDFQPGGGINAGNCKTFQKEGFKHLHCSAFSPIESETPLANDPFSQQVAGHSSLSKIQAVLSTLQE